MASNKIFKLDFSSNLNKLFTINRGIYCIRNITNGKMYFGHSTNLKKRLYEHSRVLKLNEHPNIYLQRSFNKNGGNNFKIYCCEFNVTKAVLRIIEDYYVKKFGHFNLTEPLCEGEKFKKVYREPKENIKLYRYNFDGALENIYTGKSIKHIVTDNFNCSVNQYANICYSIKNIVSTDGYYYATRPLNKNDIGIKFVTQYTRTGKFIKNWNIPVCEIAEIIKETKVGIYGCLMKTSTNLNGKYLWQYRFPKFDEQILNKDIDVIDFTKDFKHPCRIIGYYENNQLIDTWAANLSIISNYYNISYNTLQNSLKEKYSNLSFKTIKLL